MSSETSTKDVRLKPDTTLAAPGADPGLQPWQFFVLAGLGCATAVTFIARGQGPVAVVLLAILMATAALVGSAALRMLRPLVSRDEDRTVMIGRRTRVALEREKMLALRSIKELEFDRAMGKVSDKDYNEMIVRLRTRAAGLIRQLDAGETYRQTIDRELAKRVARFGPTVPSPRSAQPPSRTCGSCSGLNEADAKFCKHCGAGMETTG
jgi:hypothetical protein